MKTRSFWLLMLLFVVIFELYLPVKDIQAQSNLVGPVLVGKPIGADWLTFEDVGTNETWRVDLPNSSVMPVSWSPSGCDLLVHGSEYWGILSVANAELDEFHQASYISVIGKFFGDMIWSFDGQSLTATVQLSESDVRIYSLTPNKNVANLILSLNESGRAIEWLSETELLYWIVGGDYYVWDTVTRKSYLYKHKLQLPSDWGSEVYLSIESSSRDLAARYYSVNTLRSYISASQEIPSPEYISPEYVATLEAIPKISGFDVYDSNDGSTNHIDVREQFLQFLVWSPDSKRIAVTTDPVNSSDELNGIYVYRLADQSLQPIEHYPAMFNREYGGYLPSWLPDSNSLAFNTPDGYVIYNLITKKAIKLSEQFDGFYMSLDWSPIIDYRQSAC